MSETLDLCLEEINRSIDSISTLYFKPPGIFHNAVVHNKEGHGYSTIITKLIRDCNPKEELSLFKVDKQKGIPTRKDGKEGVLDYLTERDVNLKRNRRVGLPDEKPIIHVPKEFYLKQHDQALAIKRRKTNNLYFDVDTGATSLREDSNVFELLASKFEDEQITNLLYALENGSVIVHGQEEDEITGSPKQERRKTMFVEDFPTEAILKVLNEIANQWPLSEYKEGCSQYLENFKNLNSEIETLKKEVQLQENQLHKQLQMNPSASQVVTRLIEKEQKDIAQLEQEIARLEHGEQNSSDLSD